MRLGLSALVVAACFAFTSTSASAMDDKHNNQQHPQPQGQSHPSGGNSGGGGSHPSGGGGGGSVTHGPTGGGAGSMGSHGPTTGGSSSMGSHGPTTGGGGGSMGSHGPTTGGSQNLNNGVHPNNLGGSQNLNNGVHPNNLGGSQNLNNGGRPNNLGGSQNLNNGVHPNNLGGSQNLNNGGRPNNLGGSQNLNNGGHPNLNNTNINGGHNINNNNNGHNVTNINGGHNINNANINNIHNTTVVNNFYGGTRTPTGLNVHQVHGGATIITRPGGHIGGYTNPSRGITTFHPLNGGFHGTVWHPDHSGVYFAHGRPGFVQHSYRWHDHDFGRRAYYWHGHPYYGYYHGWGWHGGWYNVYAPGYFWHPGFYGWAYNPWYHPVTWGWGWGGRPWFGFYGGWWRPYPTYVAPAFWLTDYIISRNLEAAYEAHIDGGEQIAIQGEGGLSPEVKNEIAEEVRYQIQLEQREAQAANSGQMIDPSQTGIATMFSDGKSHVFVVSSPLDVVDANAGQECALSDGDVIQVAGPIGPEDASANLIVLASKGGNECQRGEPVTVNLSDLQEMQNQMRSTLDNGLKELQTKQGQNGMPQAPPEAMSQPAPAPYAQAAPPPDPSDADLIRQQEEASQQAEQQAQQQQ